MPDTRKTDELGSAPSTASDGGKGKERATSIPQERDVKVAPPTVESRVAGSVVTAGNVITKLEADPVTPEPVAYSLRQLGETKRWQELRANAPDVILIRPSRQGQFTP